MKTKLILQTKHRAEWLPLCSGQDLFALEEFSRLLPYRKTFRVVRNELHPLGIYVVCVIKTWSN